MPTHASHRPHFAWQLAWRWYFSRLHEFMDHFSRLLCWPVLSPVFFLVFRLRLTGSLAFYFRRRPVFITILFPSPFRGQGFTVLALCGKPVCLRTVLVKRFWRFFFLATFAYFHDTLPDIYYHCHNRYANNKDNVAFIVDICCKLLFIQIVSVIIDKK